MRVILILVLSVFMNSTVAITKCEINGKISYQTAACPENATSKFLMKDKYVSQQQLREYEQERVKNSGNSLNKAAPANASSVVNQEPSDNDTQQTEPLQLQEDELDKKDDKHDAPHVNVPRAFDYVNPKLENMDRKLQEHNKRLQQQNVQ